MLLPRHSIHRVDQHVDISGRHPDVAQPLPHGCVLSRFVNHICLLSPQNRGLLGCSSQPANETKHHSDPCVLTTCLEGVHRRVDIHVARALLQSCRHGCELGCPLRGRGQHAGDVELAASPDFRSEVGFSSQVHCKLTLSKHRLRAVKEHLFIRVRVCVHPPQRFL